jgi:hypothetical protein
MTERRTRRTGARLALCAALPLLWFLLSVAGPASAQTTNSPSGGQNTGQSPQSGGPSASVGSNTGGNAGNGTTSGGAGATGGGSSGAGKQDTGGGGRTGVAIGVVALLAVVGIGAMTAVRHRRVMEDAGAGR